MKKKLLSLFLVVFLLTASMLVGCGNDSNKSAKPFDYDLSKYMAMGEYKGLKITVKPVAQVTDADVKNEIEMNRESNAKTEEVKEGTIKEGDVANIAFVGKIDGKEFEGGSTEAMDLTIGSGQFIEGFEAGLIGAKIGETKVLNLTFPDQYPNNPDLAGKPVEFTVTINSLKNKVLPEYNLEFVKATSDFDTFEAYEANVRSTLEKRNVEAQKSEKRNAIWEEVSKAAEFKSYPPELEDRKAKERVTLEEYAKQNGTDLDTLIASMQMTKEEFDKYIDSYVTQILENEMMTYYIARAEGIEVTDKNYEKERDALFAEVGIASEEEYQQYFGVPSEGETLKDKITSSILLQKVITFLLEEAVVTEEATTES